MAPSPAERKNHAPQVIHHWAGKQLKTREVRSDGKRTDEVKTAPGSPWGSDEVKSCLEGESDV